VVESVRIDKWLWAARFFKTRSAATEAVLGGRVRLNGERVKPAKDVRTADIVEVLLGETRRTLIVREVAAKRGSARVAAALYRETAESVDEREQAADQRRLSLVAPMPTAGDRRSETGGRSRRYAEGIRPVGDSFDPEEWTLRDP